MFRKDILEREKRISVSNGKNCQYFIFFGTKWKIVMCNVGQG